VAWLVATCSYVVSILISFQFIDQPASRPGWQSGLGVIYPLLGIVTLVILGVIGRRATAGASGASSARPESAPSS